ncbi:hypothetical protein [Ammoniphilus sp. 3BR4]|uniref:hypothetical protein n=1 Tax=Ammoniphilus sp. 3BR4 TaxID=3158265 RepID=UPI003464EAEC
MKNKKLYITLSFTLIGFILIALLNYIPQYIDESMRNGGEEEDKIKVQQEFLKQLAIKESLTKDSIVEIFGHYDSKIGDYFVQVVYKDEPNVIYFYHKIGNQGFWLSNILSNGQQITGHRIVDLKNKHRFAIE